MKLFNLIYLYAILAAILSGIIAHAQNTDQSAIFNASFSVVSDNTNSVHGNEIARQFSQLLLIQDLQPLSNLELSEKRINNSTNLLSLSTPLRELTSYHFQVSMVRNWEPAALVAENFVQEAISSGLLKTRP